MTIRYNKHHFIAYRMQIQDLVCRNMQRQWNGGGTSHIVNRNNTVRPNKTNFARMRQLWIQIYDCQSSGRCSNEGVFDSWKSY